ncbi:MAG: hypothetical protein P8179_07930 [Candidatus Thiodiazotropha sp.]
MWCFIQIDDYRSLLRPGDKAQCAGKGEAIPGGTRLAANRLASRYNRQFV